MNEIELNVEKVDQGVARTIAEAQAEIIIAQKIPRNEARALQRIKEECESNLYLAEKAMYSYPRGGQTITGPSIRLAEVLCRHWGHMDFGFREIPQENGSSRVVAYCWDKQSNCRVVKEFHVKHERFTRKGSKKLDDPRDIYELVANQGMRRVRACILSVIPGYIVDEAIESCRKRLTSNKVSMKEAVIKLVKAFNKEFKITTEMIERRLGHQFAEIDRDEYIELLNIFNSLKDRLTNRSDWFEFSKVNSTEIIVPKTNSGVVDIQIEKD